MNPDLSLVLSLRKVFGLIGEGSGGSQAVVRELRSGDGRGREAARRVLLGYPLRTSLAGLRGSDSDEIAMLSTLVVRAADSSSRLVGMAGEGLSMTLERWIKSKENRRLEERVYRFRGLLASAVLGAVMAMISTIGPLVGSLNFDGASGGSTSGNLSFTAAAMTCFSSGMLGLFLSGKKLIFNILTSLVAFVVVSSFAAPLAAIPAAALWGIK